MIEHEPHTSDPRFRPAEPDHPMELDGGVVGGDTGFMAACIFEELLRGGLGPAEIRAMIADPEYQSLYAVRAALGPERTEEILARQAARVGVMRLHTVEETSRERPASLTISAPARRIAQGRA